MSSKETGPGRILVVEDEAIIATDLAETLGSLGYDVVAIVDTAEDAIVYAADLGPDLVLMDIRLAGALDGIEAAATIKERADIPVIFLTAHSDDETMARAMGTDPHGYLLKPFRASELRSAIDLALHQHGLDQRLQERDHWLAAMLQSIGDAVITTDPDHRITFLNPVAQTLIGWPESTAIGKPLDDVVCLVEVETGAPIESPLRRAFAARKIETLQGNAAVRARTGVVTPIDERATPILDDQGRALGGVLVLRDRTEQARIEDAMRRLNAELKARVIDRTSQLEAANHELAVVSRSAAHRLRAPLRGIEPHVANLGAEPLEHLRRIRGASQRMGKLLDGLLQLADVARTELHVTEVNLSELARDILGTLAPARPARVMIQDGIIARGDQHLLRSALTHLLANAWKFTGKTATPVIEFGRDEAAATPVYFVRDNGVGFAMQDAPQLFGTFRWLHTLPDFEGTGIGLAIVQRIIHRHGGRVWAEGEVERGATFRFTLGRWIAIEGSPQAWPR